MRIAGLLLILLAAPAVNGGEIDPAYCRGIQQALVKLGPRHSGSPGAAATVRRLEQEAQKLHFDTRIQSFTAATPQGPVTFYNLEASQTRPDQKFIILATHFDSKYLAGEPGFEGANDSASGAAGLLTLMQTLPNNGLNYGIKFVFFDGEECFHAYGKNDGLQGSRHYIRQMSESDQNNCLAVIVVDMIADPDLRLEIPAGCDPGLVREWQIANNDNVPTVLTDQSIVDDQLPFAAQGLPTLLLIDPEFGPGNRYWHTAGDRLGNTSVDSICRVTRGLLRLLLARNQTE